MTRYRVGIDVGETFTDLLCAAPDGQVVLDKSPTTHDDRSLGVRRGLGRLASRFGLSLDELSARLELVVRGTPGSTPTGLDHLDEHLRTAGFAGTVLVVPATGRTVGVAVDAHGADDDGAALVVDLGGTSAEVALVRRVRGERVMATLDVPTPAGFAGETTAPDLTAARAGVAHDLAGALHHALAAADADPRALAMLACGGNGPVHACAIAADLGIERFVVPKTAPAFGALGALVADHVVELTRPYVTPLANVELARVQVLLRELAHEADKAMAPADLAPDRVRTELFVQVASADRDDLVVSVPVPEGTDLAADGLVALAARFGELDETARGVAFTGGQPMVHGVRIVATGRTPKPARLGEAGFVTNAVKAKRGTRAVRFGDGSVETAIYSGTVLGVGAGITGPALIEEPFTIVVVPPGWRATLTGNLSYELTAT